MSSFLNIGTASVAAQNVLAFLVGKKKVRLGIAVSDEFLPAGAVELDASLEEMHTRDVEITRFPVEVGVDITDHARRQPEKVKITGVISNTPIELLPSLTNSSTRAEEAYQALIEIQDNQQLIAVITTLRIYENMLLKRVDVPRNAQKGNVVEVTLELEEIILVQSQTVEAPEPVKEGAQGETDLGPQAPPVDASAATSTTSTSVLAQVTGVG